MLAAYHPKAPAHGCPGGTPPIYFNGRFQCFSAMPSGFSGAGLGLPWWITAAALLGIGYYAFLK